MEVFYQWQMCFYCLRFFQCFQISLYISKKNRILFFFQWIAEISGKKMRVGFEKQVPSSTKQRILWTQIKKKTFALNLLQPVGNCVYKLSQQVHKPCIWPQCNCVLRVVQTMYTGHVPTQHFEIEGLCIRDGVCCLWGVIRTYMYRAIHMLVFDSSLQRHEFFSETVRRKYVVNKVAPGQFALRVLRFPPVGVIPPILHAHFVLIRGLEL